LRLPRPGLRFAKCLKLTVWLQCAALASCSLVALAAGPLELLLQPRQLEAMGVSFTPLRVEPLAAGSLRLPARVVIPPSQMRVLSAPAAGLIEQLSVAPQQGLRTGAVVGRLSAPSLLEAERALIQAVSQERLSEDARSRDEALFAEGIIPEMRVRTSRAQAIESKAVRHEREQGLLLLGMSRGDVDRVLQGNPVQPSLALVAPAGGTVVEVLANVGQRVDMGAPLVRIAQLDRLWLELQVPVASIGSYHVGDALEVDGRAVRARIVSVGRTASADSQVVEVRAEVAAAATLRAGETVAVRVQGAGQEGRWQLPAAAVVTGPNGPQAYVRTPRGVKVVALTRDGETADGPLVRGALRPGDEVATRGVAALRAAENTQSEGH
jgi:hypothetical protein